MKQINRRDFLKISGTAATGSALASCGVKQESAENLDPAGQHTTELPKGKMTYRTHPHNGDKVSILGYGWMRLPRMKNPDNPNEEIINQEEVNRLCNKAFEYGVNYFDTSPAYCQGKSEESLGIALEQSGRSRDSYYIATKLSNFSPTQWSLEAGQQMFENSLKYLKTDYIDYLLLHSIGGGGLDNLRKRYLDNGLLAWLMEQRAAGRIRNLGFSFHGDVKVYDYMLEHHDEYKWDFVQIQLNYIDWHDNDKGRDGEYLYNELVKRNIPAVIMEPLLGGRLSKVPDHVVAHL
ncbi:MAG: aldo/keto reductase, partial [Bacteroidaceae bacterium]|nr:aldo/keto reductase [Bacteroidaceae bacterium]